jgi:hypothetical protein
MPGIVKFHFDCGSPDSDIAHCRRPALRRRLYRAAA